MSILNLSIPLAARLANRKADKAYANRIEPMGRGFNGEDRHKTPIIYTHGSMPFRSVGYADEIVRIDHKGWYTDSFQDDTMRGVVYQLPARNGKEQFLAGTEWSCNDEIVLFLDVHDDKEDAARMADEHARVTSELYREDDEKQRAEQRKEEIAEKLKTLRTDRKAMQTELKTVCKSHKLARKTLRAAIASNREECETLAKEGAEL